MSKSKHSDIKTINWKIMVGKVHQGAAQLNMDTKDDDQNSEYHAMLFMITKKRSCSQMKEWELENVIKHLVKMGAQFKKKKNGKRLSPESKNKLPHIKDQRDKIRAIWIDMAKKGLIQDGSETALNKWVEHMTARYNKGAGIESVEWLTDVLLAQRVLEALKKWQLRLQ